MRRIATCRCGLEFFDSKGHDLCGRCRRHANEESAKIDRLMKRYALKKANGTFSMRWAVIDCYWRQRLSLQQTAKVLGQSEDDVRFEIDMARQDAR